MAAEVALAHDYLLAPRGAERTFAEIAACWPDSPIYTTVYSEEGTDGWFAGREVHTSPLQRARVSQSRFRALLPLYPWAVGRLRPDASILVSSSSGFAHGVARGSTAFHACYCHTPFRYAWHELDQALAEVPRVARPALRWELDRIRRWDVGAASRVDLYIANSHITQGRIRDCYGRDSVVLHPPVAVERFRPGEGSPGDYFLVVGELVRHKRIEVALEAASAAHARVRVVGSGPDLERLRARYGQADFLGRVNDQDLAALYAGALALVVPNVEEFGIAAVEAQAAGRPVLGVDGGGLRETVIQGATGVLVDETDGARGLAEAMRKVDFAAFDPAEAARNAQRFSASRFRSSLVELVKAAAQC